MYKLLSTKTAGGLLYIPDFLNLETANTLFNSLVQGLKFETKYMNFSGSLIGLPRKTAYFGEKDYSYSGITHSKQDFPPVLNSIIKLVKENSFVTNTVSVKNLDKLNSCLINCYENENDSVSYHSDNEKELGPDFEKNILVVSLSLGESRNFSIRTKEANQKAIGKENTDNFKMDIELKHGSLVIMYGDFQHKYEHAILKEKTRKEIRINLTFRVVT